MFAKKNTWYADWRDADGNRKRAAFTRKSLALAHEARMKQEAHAVRTLRAAGVQLPADVTEAPKPAAKATPRTGVRRKA